jgi:4-hydroxythreonine-4-phosphate dehydrogenase
VRFERPSTPKRSPRTHGKSPLLAVSIGCPAGIGPEVSVAAAAQLRGARALLVGDPDVVLAAARIRRVHDKIVLVSDPRAVTDLPEGSIAVWAPSTRLEGSLTPGRPDAGAGAAQLAWIDEATDLVRSGRARALVTGPVSKLAIATSGVRGSRRFRGHTEHLAERLGAREVVMAFWAERLVTSLVTTHLPLARVARAIRPENVASATYWLVRLLHALGSRRPRALVAALNPHAGEGGLLGREESLAIEPGIELARGRLERDGIRATIEGPLGAETAYRRAAAASGDSSDAGSVGVVGMYHDQATIPSKLVAFGDAVNVTLGLPIVRTSVDHGTAYDVAWRGLADPSGMHGALELAARLARARHSLVDRAE